jgi:anti-anti-sigma factor
LAQRTLTDRGCTVAFSSTTDHNDRSAVRLHLAGDLHGSAVAQLRLLEMIIMERPDELIIDLGAVSYLSSAGLAALIFGFVTAIEYGTSYRVVNAHHDVAGGSAAVVVFSGAGGFGDGDEGPPVAGVAETLVADLAGFDIAGAAGARVTGAVPAKARSPAAVANRSGSSPISARTRTPSTGPSPGAERRIVARGWRSNSTARACSSSVTASCIAATMAIRVRAARP